jgi:glycosyltransferase involved in cell wall biosynthesis
MAPLRILHVTPYSGDAWAYGGIARLAATLTRDLARRGHAVTVCTTDACDRTTRLPAPATVARPSRPWPPVRTDAGVVIRVFPNISNRLAYHQQLFLPRGLDRFLREHATDFDIAHLHACRNFPGAIAARHLRRANVPFVLAPNGTAPRLERRLRAKRLYDSVIGDRILRDATRVIAVSQAEVAQLRALEVPSPSIAVLPNPVDLSEFDEPLTRGGFRGRFGLDARPVVLFLGKLTPRKRVDLLVQAVAQIDQGDPTLVIAGNDMGSGAVARAAVASASLGARVRFTGLLPGRERLQALADADVVVYPSEHEIFGLVPLESLLAGTPVVVAGDSGCGEIIRATGGGQIVKAGDAMALADAIKVVIKDPVHWRGEAARAAAEVRNLFGNDAVCDRLVDLYRAILSAT